MQVWTGAEIDFLYSKLDEGTKEIYEKFVHNFGSKRSYDSVQKKVKKLRDAHSDLDDEDPISAHVSSEELVDELLQDPATAGHPYINTLDSAAIRLRKEEQQLWLKGIISLSNEHREKKNYYGNRKTVNTLGTSLCVLLSDTHFGKHTKWFNIDTAAKRMGEIPEKIHQQALPKIDEVVVMLAGDMVEGEDIYPTQNSHVECPAIEQVQRAAESIWNTLIKFRDLFQCPVRVETVPGNHGRVSKTANERSNWDNILYHILRVMSAMHGDEQLIVNCNFESFRTFKVKDKIGMAFHHGVKHTGTPAMREKIAGWTKSKKFDFLVHGHWHEWHVGNWLGKFVIANGCLCGPDDLAERMGKEDDARQAYFFITPGQPVWGHSFVEWHLDDIIDV